MYRCHTHFYLVGQQCREFEIIKEVSPLENFIHEFCESSMPEEALAAKADVILVNLQNIDPQETVRKLVQNKSRECQLILLAAKEQITSLTGDITEIKDIWLMPMTEEEIRFRFLRWQQTYKMSKDFCETEQYLETTINNVPNLVWYKTKDGIHEKVNDSFCKTVNKTKSQVEGQRHAYIWDVEQDDPACIESEQEVMNKRTTCISEEVIKTGEGMRTLTTYKSPLYDLDGSVMGTVGVAIDVTQERAYRQEIVNKNQTLETIFTTIDCGVMRHSLDGMRVLSINRSALKILGYESKEELMAEGFDLIAACVVEEDKPKLQECIRTLTTEGDSVSVEYRVQHRDGEIIHVMGNVKLLRENGELIYQRFLLDCTAQKLEEKKNQRRQMELVHALSMDYSVVCSFDLNTGLGRRIQGNDKDGNMFHSVFDGELLLEECMGQYIREFVHEDDREMLQNVISQKNLEKELTEKKQHYVNYRMLKNGKIEYFQIKVVRVGIWDERHSIVLGLRSVDEEIRNEMDQKNLLEDALLQANKASKAKSVFLSNMSHDIRTPMNAIVGFTNLAISRIDNTEQVEEYLKKIKTSGNHLLSLINDVLDMSHIESGKVRLDEKLCSLSDILHGLFNILQADIRAKQLKLQIDTVDVLDEDIYCDKLRLNQVLLNLLSNSVKYTEPGGTVSMRVVEKGGAPAGYANYDFYIKDTGIGMSEEFVKHIFEPFEREKNSTISGIQGTGLGMAITKNIVNMMKGSIEVESEQGVGTEFAVSFTFRLSSEAKEPQIIEEMEHSRVLVVNDDLNACDSISHMLEQLGMKAEWTLSGKEAVQRAHKAAAEERDYQIYIIDWQLSDMSGIEAAGKIREETVGKEPILILTAYDWADIEEEAKAAGITSFCSKPIFLSELRNCLKSVINKDVEKPKSTTEKVVRKNTGRILLAEDVELNQEIAVAILGDAGFQAEIAENGQIAVEMLKKSEPGYYQVILMDVQMPVMNGYEATREIRKLDNKELASIPIIAMTANAFEEDKQEALECGMNGHIAKPIDIERLLDTLDKIII
ncbi:MAG: response regulator [Lachnospiraceae bacterium]|nr:response regulator [Lachnospiraceae bacterium]